MEPLGLAASILTVLAAAGGSCKYLHNILLDLTEAPHDVQVQAMKLKCLEITVQQLIQAYQKLPQGFQIEPWLHEEFEKFERQVTRMKTKMENRAGLMIESRRKRWRESCKSILFDREMNKFLVSVDHWSLVMAHAASSAQLALVTQLDRNVLTLLGPVQSHVHYLDDIVQPPDMPVKFLSSSRHPVQQGLRFPSPENNTYPEQEPTRPVSDRFTQYLLASTEPVGIHPQHWNAIHPLIFTMGYTFGPLITRNWSPDGCEKYNKRRITQGFGFSLVAQTTCAIPTRTLIEIFALYDAKRVFKLNLRFNLHFVGLFNFGGPHHKAIQRGDMDYLIHQLTSRKLDITDVTTNGDTLLHLAAGHNQVEIIDMLAAEGADINATNNNGETPLHVAVRVGQTYECARRLLTHGADIGREDKDGRTPLHSFFNEATSQVLLHHKPDIDVFSQDSRGMTVMHWACRTSQSSPDHVNFRPPTPSAAYSPFGLLDRRGKSMLHFAVERGNVQLTHHLLTQPNAAAMIAPDYAGQSLLHYAMASSRFHLVDFLLQFEQFDISHRDNRGRTIMHHAAMRDHVPAMQHLLKLGVDMLHVRDADGHLPIQLARLNRSKEAVAFLEMLGEDEEQEEKQEEAAFADKTSKKGMGDSRLWMRRMNRRNWFLLMKVSVVMSAILLCICCRASFCALIS